MFRVGDQRGGGGLNLSVAAGKWSPTWQCRPAAAPISSQAKSENTRGSPKPNETRKASIQRKAVSPSRLLPPPPCLLGLGSFHSTHSTTARVFSIPTLSSVHTSLYSKEGVASSLAHTHARLHLDRDRSPPKFIQTRTSSPSHLLVSSLFN